MIFYSNAQCLNSRDKQGYLAKKIVEAASNSTAVGVISCATLHPHHNCEALYSSLGNIGSMQMYSCNCTWRGDMGSVHLVLRLRTDVSKTSAPEKGKGWSLVIKFEGRGGRWEHSKILYLSWSDASRCNTNLCTKYGDLIIRLYSLA